MTADEAERIKAEAIESKNYAMRDINYRKFAHEYSTGNTLNILFGWKGTFWPLVIMRWEVYIYPAIHIALVVWMGLSGQDDPGEEGSGEDDTVVGGADGSGDGLVSMLMAALNPPSDDAPPPFWGSSKYMVPWSVLSLLTPLMIFFLVFFLSQCYNRFNSFFATSMAIEGSLQNLTMLMLAHVTDPAKQKLKWDAVRYLTAAAMVIYSRVSKIAMGKEAQMDIENWGRLLKRERFWQAEGGEELPLDTWERMMGWPRTREDEQNYQNMMRAAFGNDPHVPNGADIPTEIPERRSICPPLLETNEVTRLRRYPGGMLSLVLCTWSMQVVVAADLKGPALGAAQAAVLQVKSAAYSLRNQLGMPVPMPYFHSLAMLQNINFALYSYALCSLQSYLTPVVLIVFILITVGMREVAVALSNPYGHDDVDFPVNKWVVAQLRSMALIIHPDNFVVDWNTIPVAPKPLEALMTDGKENDEEADDDGGDE